VTKRTTVLTVGLTILLLGTTGVEAGDTKALRAVARETSDLLCDAGFTPKVPLVRLANRYVLPDGSPSDKKGRKQGYVRGGGSSIEWDDGVKVHRGETGHGVFVYVKKDKLTVGLNKKHGATLNPSWVHILFDRPIGEQDLSPEAIARALDSVVEFRGYEPGTRMAAAFDEGLADAPPGGGTSPAPVERPLGTTVASVRVWTEPATARAGEEVRLFLEYEIQAPDGSAVAVETRTLSFAGELIPTYPVRDELRKGPGAHTSSYRQPLPGSLEPGVYSYEGKVCVNTDCISRSATFEVLR
jgi:hypothetical protein